MIKISLCIITLNEAANLERCLLSAADLVDEIVLVDSGSKDRTLEIARKFNARVVHQDWLGYVGQKNFALALAANDWVLSLDADEELSPKLHHEIAALKGGQAPQFSGFSMPRCVRYEGKWIRHGDWYPDRLVRLFRRSLACFAGGRVHERLEISGSTAELAGEIHHYSFRDAADHWKRCEMYARLWAETEFEKGRCVPAFAPVLHGSFRFIRAFLLKRGFLDGKLGFRIATNAAREVHLKYKLLRQKRK